MDAQRTLEFNARDAIQAQRYPGFATYRERTQRVIPVLEMIRTEA